MSAQNQRHQDEATPTERAILQTHVAIWPEAEFSQAQLYWLGRQLALTEDRRQRAINSVLSRSLAATVRARNGGAR